MIACPRDYHGGGILSSHWPLQSSTHADSEYTSTCDAWSLVSKYVMSSSCEKQPLKRSGPIRSLFPQWGILLKFIFVAPFRGLNKGIKRATVYRDVDSDSSAACGPQFSIHTPTSQPVDFLGRKNRFALAGVLQRTLPLPCCPCHPNVFASARR